MAITCHLQNQEADTASGKARRERDKKKEHKGQVQEAQALNKETQKEHSNFAIVAACKKVMARK